MDKEAKYHLEEAARISGATKITLVSSKYEWTITFMETTTGSLVAKPVRAKVVTTGYVTARRHQLTDEDTIKAFESVEAARDIYAKLQEEHTQKWREYYKEWKAKKSPEQQAADDEKRRLYQRNYQRKRREEERAQREDFAKRKN